jgi:enoyl-CoA hydratase
MTESRPDGPRVSLAVDDGVCVVTLRGGKDLNLYDLAMRDELIEALTAVSDLPEARALVLGAAGAHFSAGADLSEFGTAPTIFAARRIRWRRDPWHLLVDLPIPTIAALHGYALGAGLEMALLCDVRLAARDTRVGLPETRLGMLPSAGGSQTLTRLLRPAATLPLVLLAETLDAEEAEARGLVDRVVDDVDAAALRLARALARLEPAAVAAAKTALRLAEDVPLEQALTEERRLARILERR